MWKVDEVAPGKNFRQHHREIWVQKASALVSSVTSKRMTHATLVLSQHCKSKAAKKKQCCEFLVELIWEVTRKKWTHIIRWAGYLTAENEITNLLEDFWKKVRGIALLSGKNRINRCGDFISAQNHPKNCNKWSPFHWGRSKAFRLSSKPVPEYVVGHQRIYSDNSPIPNAAIFGPPYSSSLPTYLWCEENTWNVVRTPPAQSFYQVLENKARIFTILWQNFCTHGTTCVLFMNSDTFTKSMRKLPEQVRWKSCLLSRFLSYRTSQV